MSSLESDPEAISGPTPDSDAPSADASFEEEPFETGPAEKLPWESEPKNAIVPQARTGFASRKVDKTELSTQTKARRAAARRRRREGRGASTKEINLKSVESMLKEIDIDIAPKPKGKKRATRRRGRLSDAAFGTAPAPSYESDTGGEQVEHLYSEEASFPETEVETEDIVETEPTVVDPEPDESSIEDEEPEDYELESVEPESIEAIEEGEEEDLQSIEVEPEEIDPDLVDLGLEPDEDETPDLDLETDKEISLESDLDDILNETDEDEDFSLDAYSEEEGDLNGTDESTLGYGPNLKEPLLETSEVDSALNRLFVNVDEKSESEISREELPETLPDEAVPKGLVREPRSQESKVDGIYESSSPPPADADAPVADAEPQKPEESRKKKGFFRKLFS
jgi:hypothetical protein